MRRAITNLTHTISQSLPMCSMPKSLPEGWRTPAYLYMFCTQVKNFLPSKNAIKHGSLVSGVIATELSRHLQEAWYFRLSSPLVNFVLRTPLNGAQTTLYCALDDTIENESGLYYADCQEKSPHRRALIEADQKRLWEISEKLVGLKK